MKEGSLHGLLAKIECRNERGNITTCYTGIRRAKREYYEQLYANKFDYWDKTYKFPERHNLPKLTHEELL